LNYLPKRGGLEEEGYFKELEKSVTTLEPDNPVPTPYVRLFLPAAYNELSFCW